MTRKHVLLLSMAFALVAIPFGCAEVSAPQEESGGQEPLGIVLGPEDAFDIAIGWLQTEYPDVAPKSGTTWSTEVVPVVGPKGEPLAGAATTRIYSDDWEAMVHWAVVAPEYLEYVIELKSPTLGWLWTGSVTGVEGEVIEEEPMGQLSVDMSEMLAGTLVMNSPTFLFDGMPETLDLTDTATGRCPYCWAFTFEFDSAQAGYGDRTGQMLAQVITHHTAVVTVEAGDIASAILDSQWNMLQQQTL